MVMSDNTNTTSTVLIPRSTTFAYDSTPRYKNCGKCCYITASDHDVYGQITFGTVMNIYLRGVTVVCTAIVVDI